MGDTQDAKRKGGEGASSSPSPGAKEAERVDKGGEEEKQMDAGKPGEGASSTVCGGKAKAATQKTSRRKKIDRNSASAVTFRLVPASFADPAAQQSSAPQRMALQRVIPRNALKKNKFREALPTDLLRALDPEDFGIHANLDEDERRALCDQIYGDNEQLSQAAQAALTAKAKREEARRKAGDATQPTLEDLDGDCYFPKDGYDYSQHLVSLGGGVLIDHVETTAEKHVKARRAKEEGPLRSRDERLVLEALDNADDYEELLDDFVATAKEPHPAGSDQDEEDEEALLWGEENLKSAKLFAIRERLAALRLENADDGGEEDEEVCEAFEGMQGDAVVPACRAAQSRQDEKFDKLVEEYNDEFIGEVAPEDVDDGDEELYTSELDDAMNEFLQDQARRRKICIESASRKYRQKHPEEKKREDSSEDESQGRGLAAQRRLAKTHEDGVRKPYRETKEEEPEEEETEEDETEEDETEEDETEEEAEEEEEDEDEDEEALELFKPLDASEVLRIKELATRQQEEEASGRDGEECDFFNVTDLEQREAERRWDCETVLTTKTVSSFVPTRICLPPPHILKQQLRHLRETKGGEVPPTSRRRGGEAKATAKSRSALSPVKEEGEKRETADFVDLAGEGWKDACIVTLRPRGETTEERKERKKAVKEAQRMARVVKKQYKQLHKDEEKKLADRAATSNAYDVREGVRCVRL
ncbi:hypothetical protein TGVEG_272770 [Toxoplasma gondii VEG]|uniref:Uncharacterized protein n=1 Tax=Toxoplasma gondii (strain ATCC 50861 / VEG) TaxID=432359 RepID=V5BLF5_TOXGV|nr:hypothetical protein TGVEG_272770 [Toxoplasma gondii VEG]CEL75146.1 TPA: hypothetical protein BN1205_020290 [Toxoplasma gondii VEG]